MKLATCPIVLLLLILSVLPAAAADCSMAANPKISVTVDEQPVQHDRSFTMAGLGKIPSASRRAGMEAYDRTLGLTEADIKANVDIDLVSIEDGHGGFCTTARAARIVLEWKTTVHLAQQIVLGTCIDQMVSAHEEKHVAIDKGLIPIGRQAIELALTSVVRLPAYGTTLQDSQRRLQDDARAAVNQAIDIFSIVRNRKQLALDNKDEYDRVPNTCGIIEYLKLMRSGDQAGS